MKFGGTSVADPEKIQRAAARAIAQKKMGKRVVVVVSAPGDMTDELLTLSRRVSSNPSAREIDQLITTGETVGVSLFAMACAAKGFPSISLTAGQAGIRAEGRHRESSIDSIHPKRLFYELKRGRIVVVAGFQGVNLKGDIVSLGRGGSDLTAVALAAVLQAESCEIFTDVKGIYTADPRVVSDARLLKEISLSEMIELSKSGAEVMQLRSLEVARKNKVIIHVRSAFHPQKGTLILPESSFKPRDFISALSLKKNAGDLTACVSLVGPKASLDKKLREVVLKGFAMRKIKTLSLSQFPLRLSITIQRKNAETALRLIHKICRLDHAHSF